MKWKIFLTLGLGLSLGLFFVHKTIDTVLFMSAESKNLEGAPVYNQIKLISLPGTDVWMMQQGHHGLDVPQLRWDRLALVVNKNEKPYRAQFYQLEPGELKLASENEIIPNKARCFACHVSGPRAIRPDPKFGLSLVSKVKIALWNLKIKSYGAMTSEEGKNFPAGVPFKSAHKIFSRPLAVNSCQNCHAKEGMRGELLFEHLDTALFLVNNRSMPPFPFKISESDKAQLTRLAKKR